LAGFGGRVDRRVVRVGHIEDELRRLLFRFRDAAQEEITDIGHNGGAARGDAVLRGEDEESREDVIDIAGAFKFLQLADEGGT
jgi:hypothetical protein